MKVGTQLCSLRRWRTRAAKATECNLVWWRALGKVSEDKGRKGDRGVQLGIVEDEGCCHRILQYELHHYQCICGCAGFIHGSLKAHWQIQSMSG